MDITLRDKDNQLCIDHQTENVGFTVLTDDGKQYDFGVNLDEWKQLKEFIDSSIIMYDYNKRKESEAT